MKRIIVFIACLFFQLPMFAQEGVNFRDLDYATALARAQEEGKLVFVDCYTSWCGPCKDMTNNVFPQKAAGDYFNPRFVCVKYDMEKGEGKKLAEKFDVHAYPTFIIARPDGTIQHKLVGGGELDEFIKRVEMGLNKETSLLYQHERYRKGGMTKQQLLAYKNALSEANDSREAQKVYDELLARLTDEEKVQTEFWSIYEDESCVIGSPVMNFMLAHLPELRANSGIEKVDRYLTNKYGDILGDYIMGYNNPEDASIEILKQQVPQLGVKNQKNLDAMLQLADLVYHQRTDELTDLIARKLPHLTPSALKVYSFGFRTTWWKQENEIPQQVIESGNKLSRLIVDHMEAKGNSVSREDLQNYLLSLSSFPGKMDKSTYVRLAKLGEEILPNLPDDRDKTSLERQFQEFKELSYSGVHFQNFDLEKVSEQQKAPRRIFVFCHSSNKASQEILELLKQEEVGDFINPRFVRVQVAKKDSKSLKEKFNFKKFPTLFILNRDGSLLQELRDIHSPEEMLAVIREVLEKQNNKRK